jgi:hypothetical protein
MPKKTRGPWIQLHYELFDRDKWADYEAAMLEGKRSKSARKAAQDAALAGVIRLYLALGKTDDGVIDYAKRGQRIQLERWMLQRGEELLATLDLMAECSIINRECWAKHRMVTTTNAVEQAVQRTKRMDKSVNANRAKAEKKAKNDVENVVENSEEPTQKAPTREPTRTPTSRP